jgi:hypothetical protein
VSDVKDEHKDRFVQQGPYQAWKARSEQEIPIPPDAGLLARLVLHVRRFVNRSTEEYRKLWSARTR